MAHLIISRMPGLRVEDYFALTAITGSGVPAGLLLRAAGQHAGATHVVEAWTDQSKSDRYEAERLVPHLVSTGFRLPACTTRITFAATLQVAAQAQHGDR